MHQSDHSLQAPSVISQKSEFSNDFEDIIAMAVAICRAPFGAISLFKNGMQLFEAEFGTQLGAVPIEQGYCHYALDPTKPITVVGDVRNLKGIPQYHHCFTEDGFHFYAGVPLVDSNNEMYGSICILDKQLIPLDSIQQKSLQSLARNAQRIFDLRNAKGQLEEEFRRFLDSVNLISPFFLVLSTNGKIIELGRNFNVSCPQVKLLSDFDEHFDWSNNQSLEKVLAGSGKTNKLLFFTTKDNTQKYKCAIEKLSNEKYIIYANAVLNADYPISNYHLSLNHFPRQDYVSEFLFLQQAAKRGLQDAANLNEILEIRNKELQSSNKALIEMNNMLEERVTERTGHIRRLAMLPENNPFPVIEMDVEFDVLTYMNPACKMYLPQLTELSFDEILDLFDIDRNCIANKNVLASELVINDYYFDRTVSFSPHDSLARVYLYDISALRLKEIEERRQKEHFIEQQRILLELRGLDTEIPLLDKIQFTYERLSSITGSNKTGVMLFNDDHSALQPLSIYYSDSHLKQSGDSLCRSLHSGYFEWIENNLLIQAEKVKHHPALQTLYPRYLEPNEIKSVLDIPVFKGDECIGVLSNQYTVEERKFTDDDIAFSRSVADIVLLFVETEELRVSKLQLERSNNELTESYKQLVNLQAEMIRQEKMATMGLLVAGIAHEINTPLGAVSAANESIAHALELELMPLIESSSREAFQTAMDMCRQCHMTDFKLSSREERAAFRKLLNETEQIISDETQRQEVCRRLVDLRYLELNDEVINLLKHPEYQHILSIAACLLKICRSTGTINLAVNRASKVVKALNTFSHGTEDSKPIEYNLKESFEAVITLLWNKIKEHSSILVEIEESVNLIGQREEILQVWTNIINNALHASKYKCNITVNHKLENETHVITISNDGPMIPDEILPKIFDVFFTTKSAGEGSGLGLNICKKIIEQHKGTISCESTPSLTSFIINLPVNL